MAAIVAHLSGPFTWIFGPLAVFIMVRPEQTYARTQAMEALNYQVMWTLPVLICLVLMFLLIGFLLLIPLALLELAGMVMAVLSVSRGEPFRYPVNLRIFSA
jgi:uncharacterized Tic20 family protein